MSKPPNVEYRLPNFIPEGALQIKPIAKAVAEHARLALERGALWAERERLKREVAELLPADIPRVSEQNAKIMAATARIEALEAKLAGFESSIRKLVEKHREHWQAEQRAAGRVNPVRR